MNRAFAVHVKSGVLSFQVSLWSRLLFLIEPYTAAHIHRHQKANLYTSRVGVLYASKKEGQIPMDLVAAKTLSVKFRPFKESGETFATQRHPVDHFSTTHLSLNRGCWEQRFWQVQAGGTVGGEPSCFSFWKPGTRDDRVAPGGIRCISGMLWGGAGIWLVLYRSTIWDGILGQLLRFFSDNADENVDSPGARICGSLSTQSDENIQLRLLLDIMDSSLNG